MSIQVHPALRPVLWEVEKPEFNLEEEDAKEPEVKPVTVVKFERHRIDKNTMKAFFHLIPQSVVRTVKFSNNGITPSQFDKILEHLYQTPALSTVFFDWNPLYKEDFRTLVDANDYRYERPEDEPSRFAKLVSQESRIKILFLRGNELDDEDVNQICENLKETHPLKVLDISYNKITAASVETLRDLITSYNKNLEFIGLAKNNLTFEDLEPLLSAIGKKPFPEDEADAHVKKMKDRDAIIEKNKKLKASKKPEEPVPILDDIEQQDDGTWMLVQNGQLRHLNLCMNLLDDSHKDEILALLKRTPEEFSITLSGTGFSKAVIEEIWKELSTEENPELGQQRLLF